MGVGQKPHGHKPLPVQWSTVKSPCQNPPRSKAPLGLKPPFSREVIKNNILLTLPIFIVFLDKYKTRFFCNENTFCSQ